MDHVFFLKAFFIVLFLLKNLFLFVYKARNSYFFKANSPFAQC